MGVISVWVWNSSSQALAHIPFESCTAALYRKSVYAAKNGLYVPKKYGLVLFNEVILNKFSYFEKKARKDGTSAVEGKPRGL